jgi:hypothetical protein
MTSYNPQIKGVGEDSWNGNGLFFSTPEEALAYAADLQGRWMGCKGGPANRRAAPFERPPTHVWDIINRKLKEVAL